MNIKIAYFGFSGKRIFYNKLHTFCGPPPPAMLPPELFQGPKYNLVGSAVLTIHQEALTNMSSQTYVFRYAAKFYRRKGALDKALQLLKRALQATPSSAFLHHQMGLCYKARMIQIKRAADWQPRGRDRDNVDKMVRLAIAHFQFALEQKPTFDVAYIHLAGMYIEAGNHRKAEDIYQKLLCLTSLDEEKQQKVHFHYGQFQEFQKKSEVNAIIHYLKALKTEKVSLTRDKCINSLEKLTLRRLSRNASDIESLSILGFIYKVKGEMNKALEYYEQALRLAVDSGNSGT
uniref:interferon-induced protein with tetratricopeptide repeats 1-like n=1 Tax=Panthera onca TaxID=9690 RepID=UPI002953A9B8|nr:interferon-induced protein with tetratricopeptide repeats 1-like [Panthera onca]